MTVDINVTLPDTMCSSIEGRSLVLVPRKCVPVVYALLIPVVQLILPTTSRYVIMIAQCALYLTIWLAIVLHPEPYVK